jgi:hypothetical protein
MNTKYLWLGMASLLFLGKPNLPVLATDVSIQDPSSSSQVEEEIVVSSEQTLEDVVNEQLETLEGIIIALMVSFTGTGTIALIGRVAISKLTKSMSQKVLEAEKQNKISTKQAQDAIKSILDFEEILKGQVNALDQTIKGLIENQNITNENIKMMLDEFKARDEQIKDLIIKEFGDEINE